MRCFVLSVFFVGTMTSCEKIERPDNSTSAIYDDTLYILESGALPPPPIALDNPLTQQTVQLGRMLFYDTRLSADNTISCSSCHQQANAFSDTAQFSTGILGFKGGRQAMAVFNMAYNTNDFFWDGRAELLREQSLMPIQDSLEMHESLPNVVAKLEASLHYQNQFIRAFGTPEINSEKISLALEQFMHSIVSHNSKYDRFSAGFTTLTPSEQRGRRLYFQEYNPFFPDSSGADCAHCHGGLNFENDRYINNGLDNTANQTDLGRELVTSNPLNRAQFKVPSLRNIELTPPFMHDGRFTNLEEVVEHYNSGIQASSSLDVTLENTRATGLMLSNQDKTDLVAFLKTLTDPDLVSDLRYSSPF